MRKKSFRGQSTAEYAILLAIVASALIAMQIYVKRGIQGRIRDLADQISPTHYESTKTESDYSTKQGGTTVSTYNKGVSETHQGDTPVGATEPVGVPEEITRTGHETVYPDEQ